MKQGSQSSCEFSDNLHMEECIEHDVLSIGAVSTVESQPELKGRSLPPLRISSILAVADVTNDVENPIEQSEPCSDSAQGDQSQSPGTKLGTFLEHFLRFRHKLKVKCTPSCFRAGNVYNVEEWVGCSLPKNRQGRLETNIEGRNSDKDCTYANIQCASGPSRVKRHHRARSMRTRCSMIEEHFSQIQQNTADQKSHRRCVSLDDAVVFVVVSPHSSAKSAGKNFMDTLVLRDVSHNTNLVARPHPYPPVRNFQIETA